MIEKSKIMGKVQEYLHQTRDFCLLFFLSCYVNLKVLILDIWYYYCINIKILQCMW